MTEAELILIFLALCLAAAGSWLLPPRWRGLTILAAGAGILGAEAPLSLAMLAAFTGISFAVVRLRRFRTVAVAGAVMAVVATYAALMWRAQIQTGLTFVLPLGMAYYVLRTIHYMVEASLGRLRSHTLLDYATYQFLPSALLFGPIHRFDEFQRDLARRRWDRSQASRAFGRILAGAFKVVVIGNYLIAGRLGYDPNVNLADGSLPEIYRHSVLYWANLYTQFGGYSDIAIGFALLMGFQIRENFNWPFLARNIGEFWRRWHISLSTWCRDYVYMPVMAASRIHLVAISASMLTLGLWHEISLHYVLWGLYHAVGLSIWRRFNAWTEPTYNRLGRLLQYGWSALSVILTLHFVIFSFAATTWVERLIERI